ncbi:hypothetical protein [Natrinema halophilum]|uniref:Helix-hairpin-helix domain-containing protein n=1 Tax=Natrinema halophilum TaxID=1699371 RepID=A0A7D5KB54_9EURY|nr:hypothetical protein [Natrinema halophilum]QLG47481.1 hypothetical protein HYG82_00775 [Natrinema halophilum]
MSKNNPVRDTESGPERDTDVSDDIVDIGIAVDISAADDTSATAADVELELADGELLGTGDANCGFDDPTDRKTDATMDPDERAALEAVDIDPETVVEKEYSYRLLLDDGVEESIADTLRRRYSLPWSFESNGDLDRRSSEVRGLGDAEREWIASSEDEDWQAFEYDHADPVPAVRERPSERPYPRPTPITAVTGVGPDDADRLAEAGIRSAERLATIDAMSVATLLDIDVLHVRTWRHNARELLS